MKTGKVTLRKEEKNQFFSIAFYFFFFRFAVCKLGRFGRTCFVYQLKQRSSILHLEYIANIWISFSKFIQFFTSFAILLDNL